MKWSYPSGLITMVKRYHYLQHEDKEVKEITTFPGMSPYQQIAADKSENFYNSKGILPLEPIPANMDEMEKLVKAEKIRQAGNILILTGTTKTSKVKIGKKSASFYLRKQELPIKR